jgi:hypothetical protein
MGKRARILDERRTHFGCGTHHGFWKGGDDRLVQQSGEFGLGEAERSFVVGAVGNAELTREGEVFAGGAGERGLFGREGCAKPVTVVNGRSGSCCR